ncbi:MAG: hypothetical protein ABI551_00070, partial [Polyangiaceae bacterium]
MKTTYEVGSYVRRFSTKTILGALFLTSVASVTGCSDGDGDRVCDLVGIACLRRVDGGLRDRE